MAYGMKKEMISALALLAASGVYAQDSTSSTTAATTTSTSEASAASLLDNASLEVRSYFYGAGMDEPLTSMKPSAKTGKDDKSINLDTEIRMGYQLGDYNLKVVPAFSLLSREDNAVLLDPSLRVGNASLFKMADVNVSSELRAYLPASDKSQNDHLISQVRLYTTAGYEIPKSRFGVSLTTLVRPFFYSASAAGKSGLQLWVWPEVTYKISPTLSAFATYYLASNSAVGQGVFNMEGAVNELEPGLAWDITPNLGFTPYLNVKTGDRIALDTTTINAVVKIRAL